MIWRGQALEQSGSVWVVEADGRTRMVIVSVSGLAREVDDARAGEDVDELGLVRAELRLPGIRQVLLNAEHWTSQLGSIGARRTRREAEALNRTDSSRKTVDQREGILVDHGLQLAVREKRRVVLDDLVIHDGRRHLLPLDGLGRLGLPIPDLPVLVRAGGTEDGHILVVRIEVALETSVYAAGQCHAPRDP